ncbi:MAG: hypothetical protein KIS88_06860 [Anaerolineales bacterium]|nr:hypothetical protein [Anaerolineales bacterium]
MSQWLLTLSGEWGPQLLAWYQANSWVNLLFVAYGLVLLLAWRNYDHIQEQAIAVFLAAAKPADEPGGLPVLPESITLEWPQAVAGLRFPLLARRGNFGLYRCTADNAERLLHMRLTRMAAERKLERQQKRKQL